MAAALRPHEHAVLVYRDEASLRAALAAFTSAGVDADQLVVFVHAFERREQAEAFVAGCAERFGHFLERELILVSFYREAFEGGSPRIDFEHVGRVVDGLLERAHAQGKAGLRVFVDASRVYLAGGRGEEWFAFEERLGRRLHHAMALLCAYPERAVAPAAIRERMLLTHLYRFEA